MNWTVCLSFAAMAGILAGGCLSHRYGDARLQENADIAAITPDRLSLKAVPLGRAATHTLRVRNLPLPIYPTHIRVPLTPAEAELKSNLPWQNLRLRVELRALDGTTFFSNDVSFATAERGRSPGTFHQVDVPLRRPDSRPWRAPENMAPHTSYDAVVTVLQPSGNQNHRAILYGDTYVR